ncbi:hypothetical protein QRO08_09810 [Paracidovorax citrulli]|uniref:Tail fiber protein n=2 Tax=Paracidovorax citrulli TaxID=80869 RepID=A1TPQ9_PARC0|nr:hypothetical protein [Paracidovorax citrulli]ABM32947.1 hypothetical protein Aave_2372 [Paracidovorax citrulli AAC00-1]ATG93085.1 hypothetical protein CQB05_02685 [Paracidovorax citrulli]PVY67167.1 hypothetical protein C8E08_4602 [Paracidovorax citrulli]REG68670.1 hypothetical protein C8E07_1789 [Paracidovorax citrulli]RLJ93225.1 hypothetical protein C8E06_1789 [Paracidovorax citrulli]
MPQLYLNNFTTQFIASVKAAPATANPAGELDYGVLRVSDGAAGTLINPPGGSWYVLTAFKRAGTVESDYEILRVTGVDNSVVGECRLTVLRGQEGTTPRAYVAGDLVELRLTAGGISQYAQTTDPRMSDPRTPTGAAGGVLSGNYPNPGFAQPMATVAQMEGRVEKVAGKGLSTNDYTTADLAKLAGIAEQATKNAPDSQLRDRSTHTGTQPMATVMGLPETLATKVDVVAGKGLSAEDFSTAEKVKLAGVQPGAQVNAVLSVAGRSGNVVLLPGDVGLGSVDNTADAAKPVSVLQAAAIAARLNRTGDQMTGDLALKTLNGSHLAGTRNRLINGRCNVAQRGTSFPGASISTGNYPVDRLAFTGSYTPAVATVEQATDGPALDPGLRRCARLTVTTADPAMEGGDSAGLQQIIEGYNIADLFGVTFTVSFWVRSSRVGVHCLALFNGGFDKSFVAEYSVQNANTWEFKSVTLVGGLPAAGGWNTSWGPGLYVRWCVGVGPTYHTQPGAWRDGLYLGTSSQVNCLDTAGNVFALTGFRLESGAVATPFEHRQIGDEMDDCLRYFEQLNNANANVYAMGMVPNNSQVWALLEYDTKRVAPSLSFPGSVANFQFQIGSGTPSCTDRPYANSAGTKRAHIVLTSTSAGLAGDSKACLCVLAGDARININAEF